MKVLFDKLSHLIFPHFCCFCGEVSKLSKFSNDMCEICYSALPWIDNACFRCGAELASECEHVQCERCQEKPPAYDRLCALFHYHPPIRKMITNLKFSGQLAYGRILGEMFAKQMQEVWYKKDSLPQGIIPVPLSLKRLRKRGYNQAFELLRPIVKNCGIPFLNSVCERTRHTTPQSALNKEKRRRNLKNVFKVTHPNKLKNIEHIAIMDDVVTTGSTVQALSLVLKEQGVSRIDVFCCCRA